MTKTRSFYHWRFFNDINCLAQWTEIFSKGIFLFSRGIFYVHWNNDGTYHGLRMPNEAFFHQNPKMLGLFRQFGQVSFGAFGVFLVDLSAPILVLWVPCPCFSTIISTKNKAFISNSQIFFWDWDLNMGCKELGIYPLYVRSLWYISQLKK